MASGGSPTESNKQAYARYRGIMQRDLARLGPLIDTGKAWSLYCQIAAEWPARYSRRRDILAALPGWGYSLADATGRDALVAWNLARDATYPQEPVWDEMTRFMIDMMLQQGPELRLDVSSLGEPCRYGPLLRRLWAEAKDRGASDETAWQSIYAWATHRPAAWDRDDERKRQHQPRGVTSPDSRLVQAVLWQRTDDLDQPWVATVDGDRWQVRLNDFPDDHLYTLLINSEPITDFDDWPDAWDRGDRPPVETPAPASSPVRRQVLGKASARWLDRYQAGDYEAVWAEMLSLGPDIRKRTHLPRAVAVARETMRRARHNIQHIIRTLDALGYVFGEGRAQRSRIIADHLQDHDVFLPPDPAAAALLDNWEHEGTILPIAFRIWLEEVGRVDLTGSHPTLCFLEKDARFSGVYADPLMVIPTADSLDDFLGLASADDHIFMSFDAAGKAAIGRDVQIDTEYSLTVPNLAVDGRLENERHGLTFVEYLRLSFQWGGFPGWEGLDRRPERELSILREGLVPL